MKQITEDYCSFEIAKLLKEKGFEEDINSRFSPHFAYNNEGLFSGPSWDTEYNAPTHQMVLKWLREVYNLFICIDIGVGAYTWSITNTTNNVMVYVDAIVGTYEEAVEAALNYVLKTLI